MQGAIVPLNSSSPPAAAASTQFACARRLATPPPPGPYRRTQEINMITASGVLDSWEQLLYDIYIIIYAGRDDACRAPLMVAKLAFVLLEPLHLSLQIHFRASAGVAIVHICNWLREKRAR